MGAGHCPFFMAASKSAAESELQKAEAAYVKLHPLASQGNDVAPVTRGELRIILEDLLAQMGKLAPAPAAPAVAAPDAAAPAQVNTDGADELKKLSLKALKDLAAKHNIDISALPEEKDLLADYIAANMNLSA